MLEQATSSDWRPPISPHGKTQETLWPDDHALNLMHHLGAENA